MTAPEMPVRRVLTIDDGWIKGVVAAAFLADIEAILKQVKLPARTEGL